MEGNAGRFFVRPFSDGGNTGRFAFIRSGFAGGLFLQPGIYQHTGHAQFMGNFRQMVVVEEGCGGEFFVLQAERTVGVFGCETNHLSAGIGPRLVAEVADILYFQVCFLPYLAAHALFEGFACFEEAGYEAVEGSPKVAGTDEQHLVAPRDADDDCRGDGRPHFTLASRAPFADIRLPTHGRAADGAIPDRFVEVNQLSGFARHQVVREGKHIVGSTEANE